MEPFGTLALFQHSVGYNLRYKYLISDGESKTSALLSREQVYGTDPEDQVEKLDCVGHVQKRGTALRNLKVQYRGQKLSDGKTIGGAGRLTDSLTNSLQNYYGNAIRSNKGDLDLWLELWKLLCYTVTHQMKSHDTICAHLVNTRGVSGNVLRPLGLNTPTLNHRFIVLLLKPIYARLGNPLQLQKCLEGYTQNANEALHSTVWKLCPKELFLGKESVDITCWIAMCRFNDGTCAFLSLSKRIELTTSHFCRHMLRKRDRLCVQKSKYKSSERGNGVQEECQKEVKGNWRQE